MVAKLVVMARNDQGKEPGRFKTMWQVFKMTRRLDKLALPLMIVAFLAPVALITTATLVFNDSLFIQILWIVTSVFVGFLLAMITMSRRAERAAMKQMEGRPGAVGSILKSGLRGTWRTNEMPVGVNPKSQDAIYRAVGRCGIVLIVEGVKSRTERMLREQQTQLARTVKNVPVHVLHIGPESDLQLGGLTKAMRKLPKQLSKPEVIQVANRLSSMGNLNLPIPKGIDPRRVRPGRPR